MILQAWWFFLVVFLLDHSDGGVRHVAGGLGRVDEMEGDDGPGHLPVRIKAGRSWEPKICGLSRCSALDLNNWGMMSL